MAREGKLTQRDNFATRLAVSLGRMELGYNEGVKSTSVPNSKSIPFFKDSEQDSDLIRSQPVARYEVSLHSLRALVALCLSLRNGNDDG